MLGSKRVKIQFTIGESEMFRPWRVSEHLDQGSFYIFLVVSKTLQIRYKCLARPFSIVTNPFSYDISLWKYFLERE